MGEVTLDLFAQGLIESAKAAIQDLDKLDDASRIAAINDIRTELHRLSPFRTEPVDCVQWVPNDQVRANDYNPNAVAPPEMRLLEHSIAEDGYTQPIVAWHTGDGYEVIDGFHRHRVGKESSAIRKRVHGYLPLAVINAVREDRGDRMAATIRHNRARGKHRVEGMSDIVVELKRRNWTDERISRELGMDPDEILRLCQITGLTEVFANQSFSQAWEVDGRIEESDFAGLSDDVTSYGEDANGFRTVNTSDPQRIFHTHDKWECYPAGFYATTKDGMTPHECEAAYQAFLADIPRFSAALDRVIREWPHSCEHYLTNRAMNRIAWAGQAAACIAMGIPAVFRGGYHRLTATQQAAADAAALEALNTWLVANARTPVSLAEAYSYERQSDIY